MRTLWAPWRLAYVEGSAPNDDCIFCTLPARADRDSRRQGLVLQSDELTSVIMNRFPYAHAHLLVAPRRHTADLVDLDGASASAVHAQIQRALVALQAEYSPHGYNVGLNVGRAAGAGIVGHLHWHVVPRWEGDTNFMPVMADVRVMSEHLDVAYQRLLRHFEPS